MNVAVLGAGGIIAPAIVRDLAESEEVGDLLLLDLELERAERVAVEHGGPRARAAEVDVVAARGEAGAHRVEVDAVARGVDEHVDVLERRRERRAVACVDGGSAGLLAAVRLGDAACPLPVEVEQRQLGDLLRLGEVAHDRRRDDPARAEHRDIHRTRLAHAISSRARSASQNSIRSRALERSRPVSSSTRRIR